MAEDAKRDLNLQNSAFKAQMNQIKDDKAKVDKQLIETECLLSDKDRLLQNLTAETKSKLNKLEDERAELQDKVSWYRENQQLISEGETDLKSGNE